MTTLEEKAFNNLKFLTNKDKLLSNSYSIQNNEFVDKEGDSFDTIYSCKDLEYPIYFTFHQIINHVNTSYKNTFRGQSKIEIMNLLEKALDVVCEYYNEIEEHNVFFEQLVDDLDDKVFFIKQYYKYGICIGLPTFIKNMLNTACSSLLKFNREIIEDYVRELKDLGTYGSDSESESDDTLAEKVDDGVDELTDEDIPDLEDEEDEEDKKDN